MNPFSQHGAQEFLKQAIADSSGSATLVRTPIREILAAGAYVVVPVSIGVGLISSNWMLALGALLATAVLLLIGWEVSKTLTGSPSPFGLSGAFDHEKICFRNGNSWRLVNWSEIEEIKDNVPGRPRLSIRVKGEGSNLFSLPGNMQERDELAALIVSRWEQARSGLVSPYPRLFDH